MKPHTISVVIPVYKGETTLKPLLSDLAGFFEPTLTDAGNEMLISEVLLVHDCGLDRSDLVMSQLADSVPQVRPIWLTKNFGQHPATLAGISSAMGEWIITMDEDGQHAPRDIGTLLDQALSNGLQVVYAQPQNVEPHGLLRNTMSKLAKKIGRQLIGNQSVSYFHSFRLIRGEIGRTLAAYCGYGVYLDVALLWIAKDIGYAKVVTHAGNRRKSGYTFLKLLSHFWTMLLTSGTGLLRGISIMGLFSLIVSICIGSIALFEKLTGQVEVQGWTSTVVVIAFFSGCILLSLGIIAEYLAVSLGIAMGRPLYVIWHPKRRIG